VKICSQTLSFRKKVAKTFGLLLLFSKTRKNRPMGEKSPKQVTQVVTFLIINFRMYIPIYMFMYLYMYVPTYVCTYICMFLHTYVPIYVCSYIRMYLHTYIPTYICTYICMYLHMYVPTYICTYIRMYIHICMYLPECTVKPILFPLQFARIRSSDHCDTFFSRALYCVCI
jgi:hypothetical protein